MMTRDQAERLIEWLADYKDEWEPENDGCGCCYGSLLQPDKYPAKSCEHHSHIQQPIMLTDVLEKLGWEMLDSFTGERSDLEQLGILWMSCGIQKSLQDILAEAQWEEAPAKNPCGEGETNYCMDVMKGPAKDLFEYLESLFPNESN